MASGKPSGEELVEVAQAGGEDFSLGKVSFVLQKLPGRFQSDITEVESS
jgi:hypothetical protein